MMTQTSIWDSVPGATSSGTVPSWLTTPGTTMADIGGAQYAYGSPPTTYSNPTNPFGFGSGTQSNFNFGGGVNFNPGVLSGSLATNSGGNVGASGGGTSGDSSNPFGFSANGFFPYGSTGTAGTGGTGGSGSSLTGGNLFPGLSTPDLTSIFGALGPYLAQAIQTGGYNPDVFTALVNQLQPQVERGISTIGAQTGANGNRFGSGYDLALGDYLSQVNANEGAMAAGLYEQSVANSFNLLGGATGATAQYKSNQGGFNTALITSLLGALGPTLINKIWPSSGSNSPVIKNYTDTFGNSLGSLFGF